MNTQKMDNYGVDWVYPEDGEGGPGSCILSLSVDVSCPSWVGRDRCAPGCEVGRRTQRLPTQRQQRRQNNRTETIKDTVQHHIRYKETPGNRSSHFVFQWNMSKSSIQSKDNNKRETDCHNLFKDSKSKQLRERGHRNDKTLKEQFH